MKLDAKCVKLNHEHTDNFAKKEIKVVDNNSTEQ